MNHPKYAHDWIALLTLACETLNESRQVPGIDVVQLFPNRLLVFSCSFFVVSPGGPFLFPSTTTFVGVVFVRCRSCQALTSGRSNANLSRNVRPAFSLARGSWVASSELVFRTYDFLACAVSRLVWDPSIVTLVKLSTGLKSSSWRSREQLLWYMFCFKPLLRVQATSRPPYALELPLSRDEQMLVWLLASCVLFVDSLGTRRLIFCKRSCGASSAVLASAVLASRRAQRNSNVRFVLRVTAGEGRGTAGQLTATLPELELTTTWSLVLTPKPHTPVLNG